MSTKYYRDRLTGDLLLSSEYKITNSSTYEGLYEVEIGIEDFQPFISRFRLFQSQMSVKDVQSILKEYFRELSKTTSTEEAQKGYSAMGHLLHQVKPNEVEFYVHENQMTSGDPHLIDVMCLLETNLFYFASAGLIEGSDPGAAVNDDAVVNEEDIGASYGEEEE